MKITNSEHNPVSQSLSGFTCPPTIYFKFITKCDKCYYKVRQLFLLQSAMVCYYKVRQLFYYKVRQVLQSVTILLQSATIITKCNSTASQGRLNYIIIITIIIIIIIIIIITNMCTYNHGKAAPIKQLMRNE